jgi:hypothetical protein
MKRERLTNQKGFNMKGKFLVVLMVVLVIASQIAPVLAAAGDPSQWG